MVANATTSPQQCYQNTRYRCKMTTISLSCPPLHSIFLFLYFFKPFRVHHQLPLPFHISLGNKMFRARFERKKSPNKALITEPLLEIHGVILPALRDDSSFHRKERLSGLRWTFNVFLSRPRLLSSTPPKNMEELLRGTFPFFFFSILAGLKCGPLNYLSFRSDHPIYLGLLQ